MSGAVRSSLHSSPFSPPPFGAIHYSRSSSIRSFQRDVFGTQSNSENPAPIPTFDSSGNCSLHPQIRLRQKGLTSVALGGWNIVRPHCPECLKESLGKTKCLGESMSSAANRNAEKEMELSLNGRSKNDDSCKELVPIKKSNEVETRSEIGKSKNKEVKSKESNSLNRSDSDGSGKSRRIKKSKTSSRSRRSSSRSPNSCSREPYELGQEAKENDILDVPKNIFHVTISNLPLGSPLFVKRSDGRWTYSILVEQHGKNDELRGSINSLQNSVGSLNSIGNVKNGDNNGGKKNLSNKKEADKSEGVDEKVVVLLEEKNQSTKTLGKDKWHSCLRLIKPVSEAQKEVDDPSDAEIKSKRVSKKASKEAKMASSEVAKVVDELEKKSNKDSNRVHISDGGKKDCSSISPVSTSSRELSELCAAVLSTPPFNRESRRLSVPTLTTYERRSSAPTMQVTLPPPIVSPTSPLRKERVSIYLERRNSAPTSFATAAPSVPESAPATRKNSSTPSDTLLIYPPMPIKSKQASFRRFVSKEDVTAKETKAQKKQGLTRSKSMKDVQNPLPSRESRPTSTFERKESFDRNSTCVYAPLSRRRKSLGKSTSRGSSPKGVSELPVEIESYSTNFNDFDIENAGNVNLKAKHFYGSHRDRMRPSKSFRRSSCTRLSDEMDGLTSGVLDEKPSELRLRGLDP